MAKGIVETALTMEPLEVQDFKDFIIEEIFSKPELMAIHGIQTGVKMKEQIVFASQFGKTGIKATGCSRPTSGAQSILTEKFWEPAGIEDTLIHCNAEIDPLFKAYFTKISEYRQKYDITGSDLEIFFSILFLESIQSTIWRATWFADTSVAAAGAAAAGLVAVGDVQFYDYFDGLWNQIFAGVVATDVARVTITENAVVTSKPAQLAIVAGASVAYFEAMKTAADSRLRADEKAQFLVSREIYDNYRNYLTSKGIVYDINIVQEGLPSVKWDTYDVVNMETVWGLDSREDFLNNTTDNVYDLPHRMVFTSPANIPVGTLNEKDFDELEVFYDQKERQTYMGYGFTLDSKLLRENLIVVAY